MRKRSWTKWSGFGPIEPLLKDPTVNDILINTHKQCFVERFGKLEPTVVHFKDEAHLLRIIQKIVAGVGRRIDKSSPTVDARCRMDRASTPLFDQLPSMDRSVDPKIFQKTIFHGPPRGVRGVASNHGETLQAAVKGRMSLIVSGGTGSGKTTMLKPSPTSSPTTSALLRSKMRPNCSFNSRMWRAWKPDRQTPKERAKFDSVN